MQEEFENTKGVIKIRKLKKDRQHNGYTMPQILQILFSLGDRQLNLNPIHSNTTGATSEAVTAYPSGEHGFTPAGF
jgi:hypothetical protein